MSRHHSTPALRSVRSQGASILDSDERTWIMTARDMADSDGRLGWPTRMADSDGRLVWPTRMADSDGRLEAYAGCFPARRAALECCRGDTSVCLPSPALALGMARLRAPACPRHGEACPHPSPRRGTRPAATCAKAAHVFRYGYIAPAVQNEAAHVRRTCGLGLRTRPGPGAARSGRAPIAHCLLGPGRPTRTSNPAAPGAAARSPRRVRVATRMARARRRN